MKPRPNWFIGTLDHIVGGPYRTKAAAMKACSRLFIGRPRIRGHPDRNFPFAITLLEYKHLTSQDVTTPGLGTYYVGTDARLLADGYGWARQLMAFPEMRCGHKADAWDRGQPVHTECIGKTSSAYFIKDNPTWMDMAPLKVEKEVEPNRHAESKERIAWLRSDIGATRGNWRMLSSEQQSSLMWLLARLDSLILMEEIDFEFYKGRVKDLEIALIRHGEEREAHGYSRGKADAEAETKAACVLLLDWRECYGGDREGPCIVCSGEMNQENTLFTHEPGCPMQRTNLFLREVTK